RELVGGEVTSHDPLWMPSEDPLSFADEDPLSIAMENPQWVTDEVEKWVKFREDFIVFLLSVTGDVPH
ncbi:MAG: hypothetical protein ABL994_13630, partial [Verrucomicrobiales bacterium]